MFGRKKTVSNTPDGITDGIYNEILSMNPAPGARITASDGLEYFIAWTVKTPEGITVQWGPQLHFTVATNLASGELPHGSI